MKNNNHSALTAAKSNEIPSKIKTLIFILEFSLIIILLVLWFSSESIRSSKNLWVLFFYSFPSNFFISVLPHEPMILYFSKLNPPLIIALVCIAGVLPTEIINYSVIKFVADLRLFKKARQSKIVNRVMKLFNKAPFTALFVAGLSPIPFYPFRFLVVLTHYPRIKYALAVFLSRTPRYFIIGLIGFTFKIPDYLLLICLLFFFS